MHLILHIFKKDVRRVWWGIAAALSLQAAMTYEDAHHGDDSMLAVLLILAWIGLIAMAVQEDALVGDRQFWITRPPRWRVLLGSKLLFALLVIHAPLFLSDLIVFAARGFRPWDWIPQLLERQIALAAGVTLPAIALAAVIANFAYLALLLIALAGLTASLLNLMPTLASFWFDEVDIRFGLALGFLGVAALAIVFLQFARRETWKSRGVGMAGVAVAELIVVLLSPVFLARLQAAAHPAPAGLEFRLSPPRPFRNGRPGLQSDVHWMSVSVPVTVSGIPSGDGAFFDVTSIDLLAGGNRYHGTSIRNAGFGSTDIEPGYVGPDWLLFRIRRPVFQAVKNGRLELKATILTALHRPGASTRIPVGAPRQVAGVGRCFSSVTETASYANEVLRIVNVTCDSPRGFSLPIETALWNSDTLLARSGPEGFFYSRSLLSPVTRAHAAIRLMGMRDTRADELQISPDSLLGAKVVEIDFHNLHLADYVDRWQE